VWHEFFPYCKIMLLYCYVTCNSFDKVSNTNRMLVFTVQHNLGVVFTIWAPIVMVMHSCVCFCLWGWYGGIYRKILTLPFCYRYTSWIPKYGTLFFPQYVVE
jgi:hypothetical protein